jgi:adenylylsulfate kinase-like enzyme
VAERSDHQIREPVSGRKRALPPHLQRFEAQAIFILREVAVAFACWRVGEVARLTVDASLIVPCAFVSPFREERRMVRERIGPGEFPEFFVDAPLNVCITRDPKGLYAKASQGRASNVTGINSPYEAPEHPDFWLDTTSASAEMLAHGLVQALLKQYLC